MAEVIVEKRKGETRRAVMKGLIAFNRSKTGKLKRKDVTVSVRDQGNIVGGATAEVWGPTMFVELLWIDDRFRGQNHGTRIMDAVEEEGRKHGARQVYLDTFTFQARPFYEKRGYKVFGTLPNLLDDVDRFWLVKVL
jgi:GNAT superfamily N-acetyltransferase